MKLTISSVLNGLIRLAVIAFIFLNPVLFSCTKDDPNNGEDTLTNDGSAGDGALFVYIDGKTFHSRQVSTTMGSTITSRDYGNRWDYIAPVQVGKRNFVVGIEGNKSFGIHLINNRGQIAQRTQSGIWNNIYLCLAGFHVGDRGCLLDDAEGADNRLWLLLPADLKIAERAFGLSAPIPVDGDFDRTEGVGFGAGALRVHGVALNEWRFEDGDSTGGNVPVTGRRVSGGTVCADAGCGYGLLCTKFLFLRPLFECHAGVTGDS